MIIIIWMLYPTMILSLKESKIIILFHVKVLVNLLTLNLFNSYLFKNGLIKLKHSIKFVNITSSSCFVNGNHLKSG